LRLSNSALNLKVKGSFYSSICLFSSRSRMWRSSKARIAC
jgi:hypothetical protein